MIKDIESNRRLLARSPGLAQNSLAFMKMRRSTSPKRYYCPAEGFDSKKSCGMIQTNGPSKPSSSESCNLQSVKLSFTNRSSNSHSKYSEHVLAARKVSPRDRVQQKPPLPSCIVKIKDFSKGKLTKFSAGQKNGDGARVTPKNDENFENRMAGHQKTSSIRGSQRVPLAVKDSTGNKSIGNRSVSVDKRKFPARYLKIETVHPERKSDFQSHIVGDLKLLHETNSNSLMKDLEVSKMSRLHREAMKKQSILKNVYEEESWDWSSPEISPAKRRHVQFALNERK